ncbi:MAG: oligosaccharide flippase family protein, partial [Desulfobacterota bacterium]|nr:oligosaccharide flippase family protein [Thermodesulfobacteriota bacterium]
WAVPGILSLFFSGALTGAFIPLYVQWLQTRHIEDVHNICRLLIWGAVGLFGTLSIVLIIAAPVVFPLLGFGLPDNVKDFGIVVTRFLALLVLFDGASILLSALLQAEKRFISMQGASLFVNAMTIVMLVLFSERLGVFALVAGLLVGTACKTVALAGALKRRGIFLFRPIRYDSCAVRAFVLLVLPLLGSELVVNVNFLVDQIMAGSLGSGAISTLKYAYRVYDLPVQIIIIALSRALFPFASEAALDVSRERMRRIFHHALIFLAVITAPMISFGCLFAHDIVHLLFERGAFNAAATHETAMTFICYNIGLFFYAYAFINGTLFSAMQATRILFGMGCLSVVLNIVLNVLFMNLLGVRGIALSTSVTTGIISSLFILLMIRRCAVMHLKPVYGNYLRIIIATIGMVTACMVIDRVAGAFMIAGIIRISIVASVSCSVYGVLLWILRTREIEGYIGFFKRLVMRTQTTGGSFSG